MKEAKKLRGISEKIPGSGVWWVEHYDADGKRHRELAGTKATAIKLQAKRQADKLAQRKLPEMRGGKTILFQELIDDALEFSKQHHEDQRNVASRLKAIAGALGSRPASSIAAADIKAFLSEKTTTPATSNRYKAAISFVFRVGIENGKIESNPARIVRQRKEDNGRIRFLSHEEETRLIKVIKKRYPHHLPALMVALHSGMRLTEQFKLTWSGVDLKRKQLSLYKTKNSKPKHLPLNSVALAALQELHDHKKPGEPRVFMSKYGQPLGNPRKWFIPALEEAGIEEFTWHDLRHTFASRLVMAGVDLRTVQQLMGHKTIAMTIRYSHLAPEHQLDAVERLVKHAGRHTQK
jgi:integrase